MRTATRIYNTFLVVVFTILGLLLVFNPHMMLNAWGVNEITAPALYSTRRYGMMFWAFSAMFILFWGTDFHGVLRKAYLVVSIGGFGMSALSIYGMATGVVSGGSMVFAACLEAALGVSGIISPVIRKQRI